MRKREMERKRGEYHRSERLGGREGMGERHSRSDMLERRLIGDSLFPWVGGPRRPFGSFDPVQYSFPPTSLHDTPITALAQSDPHWYSTSLVLSFDLVLFSHIKLLDFSRKTTGVN